MTNKTPNNLEKTLLVVDDQWGTEDGKWTLISAWGNLCKSEVGCKYKFLFEDAFNGAKYTFQKVLDRITSEKQVDGIILDLDYGSDYNASQKGYGESILQQIVSHYPKTPVWIHSSTEDESLKARCLQNGAVGCIKKKMHETKLKQVLDGYFLGGNK